MADLNDLKREVFFGFLGLAGRVFVLVTYADDVIIGKRGFLPEEKEKGIILVFNNQMKFDWDGDIITATLGFGPNIEHCIIPVDRMLSIFSPDLSAQFSVSPDINKAAFERPAASRRKTNHPDAKVVKVDFNRKKQ